jgi:hypothetical protein
MSGEQRAAPWSKMCKNGVALGNVSMTGRWAEQRHSIRVGNPRIDLLPGI